MPPRRTRNSLESSVLPAVSSAPSSTVPVSTNAVLTSVHASRSLASASILPEFLAKVIQAIQSPVSAIVQQSFSAVVGAHSVSQGLPAISPFLPLLLVRFTWVHMAVINPGLHQLLPGFCRRSLRPVLLQYPWLRQRMYWQVCCRLLSSLLLFLFFPQLHCPPQHIVLRWFTAYRLQLILLFLLNQLYVLRQFPRWQPYFFNRLSLLALVTHQYLPRLFLKSRGESSLI